MARIKMTTELPYDLAPPFGDKRVVAARSYRPIDLRRYVIDRVFLYPCHRIAEDIVVRPVGTYRGRSNAVSLGYRGIGAPYTGGRDTESHIRVFRLNHSVNLSDQFIYILTPPIGPREVVGIGLLV